MLDKTRSWAREVVKVESLSSGSGKGEGHVIRQGPKIATREMRSSRY